MLHIDIDELICASVIDQWRRQLPSRPGRGYVNLPRGAIVREA
jgi:hypothetical protein